MVSTPDLPIALTSLSEFQKNCQAYSVLISKVTLNINWYCRDFHAVGRLRLDFDFGRELERNIGAYSMFVLSDIKIMYHCHSVFTSMDIYEKRSLKPRKYF